MERWLTDETGYGDGIRWMAQYVWPARLCGMDGVLYRGEWLDVCAAIKRVRWVRLAGDSRQMLANPVLRAEIGPIIGDETSFFQQAAEDTGSISTIGAPRLNELSICLSRFQTLNPQTWSPGRIALANINCLAFLFFSIRLILSEAFFLSFLSATRVNHTTYHPCPNQACFHSKQIHSPAPDFSLLVFLIHFLLSPRTERNKIPKPIS